MGVLTPQAATKGISEKILAQAPLVLVGRMSYSLYLWHWPVFSMIDYKMYLSSDATRLVLKTSLSVLAAALSFYLIENPARKFLNRPRCMPVSGTAFSGGAYKASALPLGISIRRDGLRQRGKHRCRQRRTRF